MAARIIQDGEISINGERYQLDGDVSWFDISQPPGKVVIGDTTDASNPLASTWEVTDLRDGIGINVMDIRTDSNRAWWSTAQLRHRGHLVLPIQAVTTAADSTVSDITLLADFKNQIYSCVGTKVHVYSNGSDSWGSSVVTLNNDATDWASGNFIQAIQRRIRSLLQPDQKSITPRLQIPGLLIRPISSTWCFGMTSSGV